VDGQHYARLAPDASRGRALDPKFICSSRQSRVGRKPLVTLYLVPSLIQPFQHVAIVIRRGIVIVKS
jgi:hypothetical protein